MLLLVLLSQQLHAFAHTFLGWTHIENAFHRHVLAVGACREPLLETEFTIALDLSKAASFACDIELAFAIGI